jgi:hypothetical protein
MLKIDAEEKIAVARGLRQRPSLQRGQKVRSPRAHEAHASPRPSPRPPAAAREAYHSTAHTLPTYARPSTSPPEPSLPYARIALAQPPAQTPWHLARPTICYPCLAWDGTGLLWMPRGEARAENGLYTPTQVSLPCVEGVNRQNVTVSGDAVPSNPAARAAF